MTNAKKITDVLVVYDSKPTRERLCALLAEIPGVAVLGTDTGGRRTLGVLERIAPDCIVFGMPTRDSSGIALLGHLRHRCRGSLLIVLSSDPSVELECRVRSAGADHFFETATEFERVIDLVRRHRGTK